VAKTTQETRARQPARFVEPMQCLAVAKLPEGPDWEYEIKFDGYRAFGMKSAGHPGLRHCCHDLSMRCPGLLRRVPQRLHLALTSYELG
jgi:hypothetical protein